MLFRSSCAARSPPEQSRTPSEKEASDLATLNHTNPHPFLVALTLDDHQFCSGTLVTRRHVLTLAHSTRGVQWFELVFGTNGLNVQDAGMQRRTAIASGLIVLRQNVSFKGFVSRAEVASWGSIAMTFGDLQAQTVGWGDTQSHTHVI